MPQIRRAVGSWPVPLHTRNHSSGRTAGPCLLRKWGSHWVRTRLATIASGGTAMPITVGPNPPPGMEGDAYSTELTAAGGTPPYAWTYDTLPAGLELAPLPDSQRAGIRGVPTQAGSTRCTIRVTDSTGDTVSPEFTLEIGRASCRER